MAALLAARDFTSSEQMLEAQRGWARAVSSKQNFAEITSELGTRFEMALNTYKPFACGIVIHPIIDGCVQLRTKHALKPADIAKVELRVHPLVLELTGKTAPRDGLESKFSVYHAAAIALLEGRAGPRQFSDAAAQADETVALRRKVAATIDPQIKEEQADVTVVTTRGERLNLRITHAVGSVENPVSDQALEAKTTDLMEGVLPEAQIRIALRTCWNIGSLPQASSLATVLRPPGR
jgi:2-methylcitrate dehydratase PrpD